MLEQCISEQDREIDRLQLAAVITQTDIAAAAHTSHLSLCVVPYSALCNIRRLTKRYTGKPTQVVKVECNEEYAAQLLKLQLVVNNKICSAKKKRKIRVIRCLNCQSLGHLARHSNNIRRCELCAGKHEEQQKCGREWNTPLAVYNV